MRFQLDVHDLVNRGLVTRKYDEATGLYVLKYNFNPKTKKSMSPTNFSTLFEQV